MHGFVHALIVGLLIFSASDISSLVVSDPCTGFELPGSDDGSCPPTCVTCGCCVRAIEPAATIVSASPEHATPDTVTFIADLFRTDPHDILHVPKALLS